MEAAAVVVIPAAVALAIIRNPESRSPMSQYRWTA